MAFAERVPCRLARCVALGVAPIRSSRASRLLTDGEVFARLSRGVGHRNCGISRISRGGGKVMAMPQTPRAIVSSALLQKDIASAQYPAAMPSLRDSLAPT